jgi:hypothetical protein
MSTIYADIDLVEAAKAHVREVSGALTECGTEPLFTIRYEDAGAGTDGILNVAERLALKFLCNLVDTEGSAPTPLKAITVTFRVRPKVFAA